MFILYCDSITSVARVTTEILPDMYLSHRICTLHTSYCWLADYRSLYTLHCLLMAFWLPVGLRSLKTLLILVVLEELSITVCRITPYSYSLQMVVFEGVKQLVNVIKDHTPTHQNKERKFIQLLQY